MKYKLIVHNRVTLIVAKRFLNFHSNSSSKMIKSNENSVHAEISIERIQATIKKMRCIVSFISQTRAKITIPPSLHLRPSPARKTSSKHLRDAPKLQPPPLDKTHPRCLRPASSPSINPLKFIFTTIDGEEGGWSRGIKKRPRAGTCREANCGGVCIRHLTLMRL